MVNGGEVMRSKRTKARFKYFVMNLLNTHGPQTASEISAKWNEHHRPYVTPREVSALLRSDIHYFERDGTKWSLRCKNCAFDVMLGVLPLCFDNGFEIPEVRKSIEKNPNDEIWNLFLNTAYDIIMYWLPCKIVKPQKVGFE